MANWRRTYPTTNLRIIWKLQPMMTMRSVMICSSFRALIGHQGPLKPTDPNWKGCKYNVLVDWETGEKTYEPLSVLAADDTVTCAL